MSATSVIDGAVGAIHQFPPRKVASAADVTLQTVINEAAAGDCIYIAPGTYKIAEPLAVHRDLFLLGFDDADGRKVVIEYDGGCLTPALAALRIEDGAKVVIASVQFSYSHDVERSDPARASTTHAIRVFGGSLELRDCTIVSTVCGVDVRTGASFSGLRTDMSVACVAVDSSGRAHLQRGTVAGCTVGLRASAEPSNVSCDDTLFISCSAAVVVEELAEASIRGATMKECRLGVAIRSNSTRADPVSISGSEFRECGHGVIVQGQCCNPTVTKCVFDQCTTCGICVDSGSPSITGCAVTNTPIGMEILSGEAVISECAIEDFSDVGILISGPSTMPRVIKCLIRADASGSRQRVGEGAVASQLLASAAELLEGQAETALPPKVPTLGIVIEETAAPQIEDTTFDNTDVNIFGFNACGVVEANVLGVTEYDSVVFVGPSGDVVVRENDFLGTRRGTGVGIYCGSKAMVCRNKMEGIQLAGVTLRSCGETVVTENEFTECQDAVVAMGRSLGIAHRNTTELAVVVFTDAVETFSAPGSGQQ